MDQYPFEFEFDVLGMDVDNFIDVLEKAGYDYQAQICK